MTGRDAQQVDRREMGVEAGKRREDKQAGGGRATAWAGRQNPARSCQATVTPFMSPTKFVLKMSAKYFLASLSSAIARH